MAIVRMQTNDRMSQIVVHGNTVYLAGQVAQDSPGASIEEQTQSILNQVETLLTEAGTTKENILSATIWLTDMADFAAMNSVWDEWLPRGHAPSRACVESAKLAADYFNVEIGIIAAK